MAFDTDGIHALTFPLANGLAPFRTWLRLPAGYVAERQRAWPLVVALHGSGERGDDLARVTVHGLPRLAAQGGGRDWPFVLAAPQLEDGLHWAPERLHALLDALLAALRVDAGRVTATGLSLGGHGAWNWACACPDDLAGIAPVCGHGDPAAVTRMTPVPVRAYHGDADTVVPLARQQACVQALRDAGGTAEFIVYAGVGHNAWDPAYADPGLLPWLMQRHRGARPAGALPAGAAAVQPGARA